MENYDLLPLKARRKGFTKSHFATVINSIMENYDFIIIELFPIPNIVTDEKGKPLNFINFIDAAQEATNCQAPLIIDIKKLQNEKEIDDMAADMSW
jgi:molybdopterin-guanine dinucleotide biosynthesis protein